MGTALERASDAMGAPLPADPDRLRPAGELARDAAAVAAAVERTAEEIGTDRADVAAQRLVEVWAWNLGAPGALLALDGAPLPSLAPGDVRAELTETPGTMPVFAFSAEREAGDLGEFVTGFAELCRPLVAALNEISLRPARALWRGAGDRLAGAFLYAGELNEEPDRGAELAAAALDVPTPFAEPLRLQHVEVAGRPEPVQIRNGCCIWHRVPGAEPCITCPLVCAADRERRTREWRASPAGA